MHKTLLLLLWMLSPVLLPAQDKASYTAPDWKKIARQVAHPRKGFDYDALGTRLLASDTTLSLAERRFLYYGQIFRDNKIIYSFTEKNLLDSLYTHAPEEALALLKELRNLMPASLVLLREQYFFCLDQGYDECAQDAYIQIVLLAEAMFSTGNGTDDHPLYVISPTDEYTVLQLLQLSSTAQDLEREEGHYYDRLYLEPNEFELESMRFDICAPISWLEASMSEKPWKGPDEPRPKKKKKNTRETLGRAEPINQE